MQVNQNTGTMDPMQVVTAQAHARTESMIKFILEVQKIPVLYDGSSATAMQRQHAWQQCATNTGLTVEDSRKLWKSLRDRFVKEVRKAEDNVPPPKHPWPLLSYLKFLQEHIKERRSAPDVSSMSGLALLTNAANGPATKRAKLNQGQGNEILRKQLEKVFSDYNKEALPADNAEDLDELFFMSLLPDIKRLPATKKYKLKIKIMETVQEYLFQEENKTSS